VGEASEDVQGCRVAQVSVVTRCLNASRHYYPVLRKALTFFKIDPPYPGHTLARQKSAGSCLLQIIVGGQKPDLDDGGERVDLLVGDVLPLGDFAVASQGPRGIGRYHFTCISREIYCRKPVVAGRDACLSFTRLKG
jgi:hypothetical protein